MKKVTEYYKNSILVVERDFRNMFNDFYKFMNEQRKSVDLMSILINKAIGIDKLYNDPIVGVAKSEEYKNVQIVLEPLDDDEDEFKELVDEIQLKFPQVEFDSLFKQTESHLTNSFNIIEIAKRLSIINSTLYNVYLFYNQNIDIQLHIVALLDKKYRINSITRETTNSLIEESIEEGLRNNIIDFEF
jgi:hypothetical protein